MAREIEIIKTIKETLNIVLSGFMALAILKHIYNLLLTTLGIENSMIIEHEKNINTDEDKGEK